MIQGLAAIQKAGETVSGLSSMPAFGLDVGGDYGNRVETSFTEALSAASLRAVEKLEGAEMKSIEALQGDVDTREVVDAVMGAEQTLSAGIAIRDKIVSAYLEISRMAI